MFRIDLRHHHGYIGCPAVGRIVGNNGRFCFCVCLLDLPDLFLGHVNGTEHEIHLGCNFLHLIYVHDHKIFDRFRHGRRHFPSAAYCLFIGLSCRPFAGRNRRHLKPGMVFKERNKSLAYHSRTA